MNHYSLLVINNMPNRNGKGPNEKGPRTGRGMGPCKPKKSKK